MPGSGFFMGAAQAQHLNNSLEPGETPYQWSGNVGSVYANSNIMLQKEFAKNGVRWRVDDAKAAGIHPLYGIGAQGASFSPVAHVSEGVEMGTPGIDQAISMGQNILRAATANSPMHEKQEKLMNLQIERGELENDLLRSRILNMNAPGTGPGLPTAGVMLDGQGNSRPTAGLVVDSPLNRTISEPGRPEKEVGAVADYTHVKTPFGYGIIPSKDVKERIEDTFIPETMHSIRNGILPNIFPEKFKPKAKPPAGYNDWAWSPLLQQFVPWKSSWKSSNDATRERLDRGLKRYVK